MRLPVFVALGQSESQSLQDLMSTCISDQSLWSENVRLLYINHTFEK